MVKRPSPDPRARLRLFVALAGLALAMSGGGPPARAQPHDRMLDECARVAQTYFRDWDARADMRYNGQRTDGTHAINGRIFLETRAEDFACSYERSRQRMVEFFAEGRVRNAYLPGGGSSQQGSVVQVTGLRGGDTLNVRSGPGTGNRVVGVLANGTSVRNLGCRMQGNTRWCEIEMMTDMRERGWVAGRYLTRAGSAPPPASGPLETVTGVPEGDVLNVRAGPGTGHRIVGALGNGAQVRNLGCRMQGRSRWCRIEMQTDMRERGWVNARYLTGRGGQASQLPGASRMQRVQFPAGSTGTELTDRAGAGTSVTYVLDARGGQTLYVRLAASGPDMSWRLFNPDGSLLDRGAPSKAYRGQLFQSGDHRLEVTNGGNRPEAFNVIFGIE